MANRIIREPDTGLLLIIDGAEGYHPGCSIMPAFSGITILDSSLNRRFYSGY